MRYTRSWPAQAAFVLALILSLDHHQGYADSRGGVPTWKLPFRGTASGGTLVLSKTLNRNVKYVSIQTSPGESAQSVAQRLADTINAHHSRQADRVEYDPHWLWVGGFQASALGDALILPLGPASYILGGTETGLGIPRPPQSVSCSYQEPEDRVVTQWTNATGGYDLILITCYWTDFDHIYTERIPGTATTFGIDRKKVPVNLNDMEIRVVGIKDDVPSNATAIHVSGRGHCQEETYGIPFAGGLAPNWAPWSTASTIHKAAFEQAEKYPNFRVTSRARTLSTKPFYQVIKAPPKGAAHGIYRRFLGLTPAHTYRITACGSTLAMDSITGNWSLSLHAAPSGPGKDLTAHQLAGSAALPYANSGPPAGRITSFTQGNTTKGNFDFAITGYTKLQDGSTSSQVTLPPGVNEITVWIRFSCADPKGQVGFAGVKLEDITASPKVKSADQIISEEVSAEAELLRWEQRALRRESP